MQIIKTELSSAAQAGALDASLAFSQIYTQHRELVTQSALSGLQGLQSVLSDSSVYSAAISHLQEATENIETANTKAQEQPFQTSSNPGQHTTATTNGLKAQAVPYQTTAGAVQNTAQIAINGTDSSKPERNIANDVKAAADLLKSGMDVLVNSGDLTTALSRINQARANAQSTLTAANALKTSLQGQTPVPTARINALNAVINSAHDVINTANSSQTLTNSPIAQIRNELPITHDLGDGYTLANWGDCGYMTLVDGTGQGVIISPDGTVDPLNGSGEGWKFNSTSTFVLPNQTKITMVPGSTASIQITRGIHAFTIDGVGAGQNPAFSDYNSLNGRELDRANNDGHILQLDGSASSWRLNGQVLGDLPGSREVVATTVVTNELKLDPTDVAISPELIAFLDHIGVSGSDYDGDGKLNNEELGQVAGYIYNYVQQLQEAFATALANVAAANEALFELNELLELMRQENDARQTSRQSENAETRAALQAIERKLIAALEKLRGIGEGNAMPNIESSAQSVLTQLQTYTQTSSVTSPSNTVLSPTPTESVPTPNNSQNNYGGDSLGDSLRRASRLLSGFLGAGNFNTLPLPEPVDNPTPAEDNGTPSIEVLTQQILTESTKGGMSFLDDLGVALANLSVSLDPKSESMAKAEDLSAALQALFTLFDELGVLPPGVDLQMNGSGVSDVLQSLNRALQNQANSSPPITAIPEARGTLGSFIGSLGQLGDALKLTQVSSNQLAGVSTASLEPRSRIAEQLALVLSGLAALGSAGADQSSGSRVGNAPTSMELRLGLQSFLSALAGFGLFVMTQPTTLPQQSGASFNGGSTAGTRAISGNFATAPQLMKQLQANLNRAIQEHQSQVNRASTLFATSQEVVQKFVSLIKQDDMVRDIIHQDSVSDQQQTNFDERMMKLKQDWGMEWGSHEQDRTPAGQTNLVSKAVQSGMMV